MSLIHGVYYMFCHRHAGDHGNDDENDNKVTDNHSENDSDNDSDKSKLARAARDTKTQPRKRVFPRASSSTNV